MKLDVSTLAGYSIAAALRGPDIFGFDALKWLFTARLRYWLGVSSDHCSVRTTRRFIYDDGLSASLDEYNDMIDTASYAHCGHWLAHISTALRVLNNDAYEKSTFSDLVDEEELIALRDFAYALIWQHPDTREAFERLLALQEEDDEPTT